MVETEMPRPQDLVRREAMRRREVPDLVRMARMHIFGLFDTVGWAWFFKATGYEKESPMLITVTRTNKTPDGIFGNLQIDVDPFKCVTCENLADAIPVGIYDLLFMWSEHFQQLMPHVIVPAIPAANLPKRVAIEVHWANYPNQLEGCIALGDKTNLEADSIDNSKVTWVHFVQAISDQPAIKLKVVEDYA